MRHAIFHLSIFNVSPSLSSSLVIRPASESLDEILELDIREQSTVSSPCILSRFFGFVFLVGLGTLISQSMERSLHDLLRFPHLKYISHIKIRAKCIYRFVSQ